MSRLVAVIVVFVAVVGSGAAAGLWTGRWGSTQALREAAARLDRVPLTLGDAWDGHPGELSDREIRIAELEGYLQRRYVHRRTGNIVSVLLVCGRPGPISVHVPEVCYAGAGFEATGPRREYDAADSKAQFQVQDFQQGN